MTALSLCAALLLASEAGAPAAEKPQRIAIYPLQPLGIEAQIADRLDAILREEVARLPQVKLQGRAETQLVAEQVERDGRECSGKPECLARIGLACGVEKFLYGTVATLGDSFTVDLKLVDVASKKLERRLSERLSGDETVLIDGVRELAAQLISPTAYVGTLELREVEVGALVFVDGRQVGSAPLTPLPLEPGKHAVKITKDGFQDFDRFVEISFGRNTAVSVNLRPLPADALDAGPSPFESPVFTAGVITGATGGAALLVGAGFTGFFVAAYSALSGATEARGPRGERVVTDPATYETWRGLYHEWMWTTGLSLVLGGAVFAGAGTGLALWDLKQQEQRE